MEPAMAAQPISLTPARQTERRVAWLIPFFGSLAAAAAAIAHKFPWAAGLMIGSILAWLNFRWLKQGMDTLVIASQAQSGAARPRVPVGTYFRALFRYALIALTVYVIFILLKVPPVSMVVGLCALGPAVIAASVYEIVKPRNSGT
jgi:small-conductance mechanosensitive channel